MLFFTQLSLASIDKKIIHALNQSVWFKRNKDCDIYKMSLSDIDRTENWVSYVDLFIDRVLRDRIYFNLVQEKELNKKDLVNIFLLMIIATLPNPLFKTGKSKFGYTLVASAMYQEINKQLKEFLGSLSLVQENDWEKDQFGYRYATHCVTFARHLKRAHENAYGKIEMIDVR